MLLLIFLIYPLFALPFAFKYYDLKISRIVVYLFLILFGFTIIIGDIGNDSFEYAKQFIEYNKVSLSQFLSSMEELYSTEEKMDVVKHLIMFLVSRFSEDYRYLFGVFAAIFGYFYLKSINSQYDQYRTLKNINVYLFFIYFTFAINPIFNINGFRFWTASWVFFWGAYNFIVNKEKKFFVLAIASSLFHFSFIFPILLLIVYLLLGNRNKIYFVILIFSFFIKEVALSIFPQIGELFGGGLGLKVSGYTGEARFEVIEAQSEYASENGLWYMWLPGIINFYYFLFVLLYLYWKYKSVLTKDLKNKFSFALLLFGAINLVSFVPSMGRFRTLIYMFVIIFAISVMNLINYRKIKWYIIIGVIPFILNFSLHMRLGLDLINPFLFGFTPLPFLYGENSLYNLIFS